MGFEYAAFLSARKAWRDGFKQHGFGSTNERWRVVMGTNWCIRSIAIVKERKDAKLTD